MDYVWRNVLIESCSIYVGDITASNALFSGVIRANEVTASLHGTASHAVSASWAPTDVTSSAALSASYAGFADTASYAFSASVEIVKEISSSHADFADTASFFGGGTDGYFPFWESNTLSTSSLVYQSGASLVIGPTVASAYPITVSGSIISEDEIATVKGFTVKKLSTFPLGVAAPVINVESVTFSPTDHTILRTGDGLGTLSGSYGFSIKHMHTRGGNDIALSIFADDQTSNDQIEALTILQDGKIGIQNADPVEALDVDGNIQANWVYGTASMASTVEVSQSLYSGSYYLTYVTGSDGYYREYVDEELRYDPITNTLSVPFMDGTASFVLTASYVSGASTISCSYAGFAEVAHSASFAIISISSSYAEQALSASWAPPVPSDSASYATFAETAHSASYAVNSDTASISLSTISASYADQALSASWAPSATSDTASYVAAAGNDREVQINSSGSFDTETNFVFTTDTALGISGTGTEPLPITGGLYFNLSDGTMKMCIDLDKLYYTTISGSGGGGWLPTDLPELELWYASDQITGVANGDTVTTFTESSGNNRNISQSVEGQKPKYYTNVQNGLPAVRFDGVDDYLVHGPTYTVNQPNTHYLAVLISDITSSTVNSNAFMFDGQPNRTGILYRTSSGQWGMYTGIPGSVEYGGTLVSSSVILTLVSDGVSAALYQNGSLIVSGNGGNDEASGFVMAAISNYVSFFARMDFFEYLMVTGSHDSASRAQVISYLSDKWDISY